MKSDNEERKKISWFTIIFLIIMIPILIVNIVIIYKANKYPDRVPDFMGYKPFAVMSGSMQSNIMKGDLVIVKQTDTTTLKVGDIIAFKDIEGYVTTHRIINIIEENGKTCFITKGDNNNIEDDTPVYAENIEGKYILRIPNLGNFVVFLQEPLGFAVFMLTLFIIGLLIFVFSGKNNGKLSKADEEYLKEFEEFKRKKETEKIEEHTK